MRVKRITNGWCDWQRWQRCIPITLAWLKASEVFWLKVGHKKKSFMHVLDVAYLDHFGLFFLPLVCKQHRKYPSLLVQPASATGTCAKPASLIIGLGSLNGSSIPSTIPCPMPAAPPPRTAPILLSSGCLKWGSWPTASTSMKRADFHKHGGCRHKDIYSVRHAFHTQRQFLWQFNLRVNSFQDFLSWYNLFIPWRWGLL